jgi:hypothetical protein
MFTEFWSKNFKGRDCPKGLSLGERIPLKWILRRLGVEVWTGLIWLKTGTSGGLL